MQRSPVRFFSLALLVLLVAARLGTANAWAQAAKMSKAEEKRLKKEWKTKAKSYVKNPLALKTNVDNNKKTVDDLTQKNAELNARLSELQADFDKTSSESKRLVDENQQLRTAYEAAKNASDKGVIQGLVFKVQIGAFRYFDMSKYLKDTEKNFEGESQDNLNKFTLGNFRDLQAAEAFKKDIRKMGVKDAFIVPYNDGVRVDMPTAKRLMDQGGMKGSTSLEGTSSSVKPAATKTSRNKRTTKSKGGN